MGHLDPTTGQKASASARTNLNSPKPVPFTVGHLDGASGRSTPTSPLPRQAAAAYQQQRMPTSPHQQRQISPYQQQRKPILPQPQGPTPVYQQQRTPTSPYQPPAATRSPLDPPVGVYEVSSDTHPSGGIGHAQAGFSTNHGGSDYAELPATQASPVDRRGPFSDQWHGQDPVSGASTGYTSPTAYGGGSQPLSPAAHGGAPSYTSQTSYGAAPQQPDPTAYGGSAAQPYAPQYAAQPALTGGSPMASPPASATSHYAAYSPYTRPQQPGSSDPGPPPNSSGKPAADAWTVV